MKIKKIFVVISHICDILLVGSLLNTVGIYLPQYFLCEVFMNRIITNLVVNGKPFIIYRPIFIYIK